MTGVADKPPSSQQEQREAARLSWLERAATILDEGQRAAEGSSHCDAHGIARAFKALVDGAAKADYLGNEDRQTLTDRARAIEFVAYERAFDQVLASGRGAIRSGDKAAYSDVLKQANEVIAELRKRGLDQHGYESLKEKIELLRETASPGTSEKAKADEKDSGPKAYANDRRSFMRYTDPPLIVEVGGRRYMTADWSLSGVMIRGIEHAPGHVGGQITIRLKVEAGRAHEERVTIVRYVADKQELALQFRRFGSALVMIKKECEHLGVEPS
jgi:hypothetical protein